MRPAPLRRPRARVPDRLGGNHDHQRTSVPARGAVVAVAELLRLTGIPVADDEIDDEKAFLAASSLLMALGVTPVIDNEDDSTAASIVRRRASERR